MKIVEKISLLFVYYTGIYNKRFGNGLLNETGKMIIKIPETKAERVKRLTGFDIRQCPACKKGKLVLVATIPRAGSPSFVFKNVNVWNEII